MDTATLIKKVRQLLTVSKAHFLLPALYRVEKAVVEDREMDTPVKTDGRIIRVNPERLSTGEECINFLHVFFHYILEHPLRLKFMDKRNRLLWNLAADCKVNAIMSKLGLKTKDMQTARIIEGLTGFSPQQIEKMTTEQIYLKLAEVVKIHEIKIVKKCRGRLKEVDWDLLECLSSGCIPEVIEVDEDMEECEEGAGVGNQFEDIDLDEIRRGITEALKSAGNVAAKMEEVVDAKDKSKINWKRFLRTYFREWISHFCVSTWKRPSRKVPDVKGKLYLGKGKVYVLVDTSGSIGHAELEQFMAEIKTMNKDAEVYWGCWDVDFYGLQKVKNSETKFKIRGRGGTDPTKALKEVKKVIKPHDMLVILTDGEWYGNEWKKYLNINAKRKLLLTTSKKPFRRNDWTILKIDL